MTTHERLAPGATNENKCLPPNKVMEIEMQIKGPIQRRLHQRG